MKEFKDSDSNGADMDALLGIEHVWCGLIALFILLHRVVSYSVYQRAAFFDSVLRAKFAGITLGTPPGASYA